jgi:hypothetical protein
MLLYLVACASTLDDPTPYVDDPGVLAVRTDPAEVAAGEDVTFTALYADASGELDEAPLDWSFCTARRPLAELGPVAPTCLDAGSGDLLPIGSGLSVTGTVPDDACSLFGPNPPPAEDGETGGRPTDPDVTGGYYQPAVTFDGGVATLAPVRVRCGLANVTQDTYVAWNQSYTSNVAPTVTLDAPASAAPGEEITLTASWPECGEGACDGAETYVVYDSDTRELTTRREAISATWFATGGTFGVARNGRAGDAPETSIDNTWIAPEDPATVWVVLRDERGGVGFASARFEPGSP